MRIAIHQPNYMPWLGYWHKMSMCDAFVFFDDCQFSKGSYTNRVRVRDKRWLSVPVNTYLGQPINKVKIADTEWKRDHLAKLENYYRDAPYFGSVWPEFAAMYEKAFQYTSLHAENISLIISVADKLGLIRGRRFLVSSWMGCKINFGQFDIYGPATIARLIELIKLAGGDEYLHGRAGYIHTSRIPNPFDVAGIRQISATYSETEYPQNGRDTFESGLSVLDAVFNVGWQGTRDLCADPDLLE